MQRFHELGLRFPRRSYGGGWDGKLLWGRLTHSRVLGLLANRHRLAANRTNAEVLVGPAREGLCLLQGLLVCGTCGGRRLGVRNSGNGGLYQSSVQLETRAALSRRSCMASPSAPLDSAIGARVVAAVTPHTIDLAVAALSSPEDRDAAVAAQWRRCIERTRFDADSAEWRYEAVDPASRLIAATLEQRWNDACSGSSTSRPRWPSSSVRPCGPSPPNRSSKSCSWERLRRRLPGFVVGFTATMPDSDFSCPIVIGS
ncbi:hypothetical protein [Mesorhizobium sp. M0809]|uniref:hypothetical protein n=1 Tax=Mesorhizobium sp. M0809 TaxID=2957003 RepID=UPI00333B69ED